MYIHNILYLYILLSKRVLILEHLKIFPWFFVPTVELHA